MTIDDLREQGVLLPEEEWGKHSLKTTAPRLPLAVALLVATAGCALMLLGDGGILTWVGVALFIVTLYASTWMLDRAVARQRERARRERAHRDT
ncbi:MAG: hypothetical protein JSV41_07510 [Gemmatimonadota bacterium]|nr:MAG: hypothetical protein JSV41_07510 [Gemmatimonadota bacterium]